MEIGPTAEQARSIQGLSISGDGKTLAVADSVGAVIVSRLPAWQEAWRFESHLTPTFVTVSCDGRTAAVSSGQIIAIFDIVARQEIRRIRQTAKVEHIGLSADGKLLAATSSPFEGGDNLVRISDVTTGQQIRTVDAPGVAQVLFSCSGRWLALPTMSTTRLVELKTWGVVTLKDARRLIAFSRDDRLMASSPGRSTVVWDTSTWRRLALIEHEVIEALAFREGNQQLVTLSPNRGSDNALAQVWQLPRDRLPLGADGSDISDASISANGEWLATGHFKPKLARVHRVGEWTKAAEFTLDNPPKRVTLNVDGTLLATLTFDGQLQLWDVPAGRQLKYVRLSESRLGSIPALAVAKNSVAIAYGEGVLQVRTIDAWDEPVEIKHAVQGTAGNVAFASSTGAHIAVIGTADFGQIFSLESMVEVGRFRSGGVTSRLSFSSDGKRLAVGGWGVARVFDARTWSQIAEFVHAQNGQLEGVDAIALSSNGEWLATGTGFGGILRVWSITAGTEVARLQTDESFTAVAFNDNARITALSLNYGGEPTAGHATLFEWRARNIISAACQRLSRNLTPQEWATYFGDVVGYAPTCPTEPR